MVEPPPQFATLGVNSYRNQSGFELLTSDGTPIPTQGKSGFRVPSITSYSASSITKR